MSYYQKLTSIGFLSVLIFLGAGCTSSTNVTPSSTPIVSIHKPTIDTNKPLLTKEQTLDLYTTHYFSKKLIPFNVLPDGTTDFERRLPVFTYNRPDCLGYENGYTRGGDLLTTLINDQKLLEDISTLSVYTTDYLKELLKKTESYVSKKYPQENLYSYYICHLGTGVDVVSGNLWQPKKNPYSINDDGYVDTVTEFSKSSIMIVIRGATVQGYKNIQTISGTATGGETAPCSTNLSRNGITVSCFAGLHECPGNVTVGQHTSQILFRDGSVSTKRTELNNTCEEIKKELEKNSYQY